LDHQEAVEEKRNKRVYSADTNIFMEWRARFYPADVFATLEQNMNSLVAAGRLIAPALVEDEINAVGTADVINWASTSAGLFVPLDGELLSEALQIQNQFPGLRDAKAEYEEADAYVIALARIRNGTVVTQETSALEKRNPKRTHYMPDVCRELGIDCISLLGLMRRERWRL
jgi:hypothetical protein